MDLMPIFEGWRPREPDVFWAREVKVPKLSPDLVTIIQGVRRSGKSTLLGQLMRDWGLDPGRCFFVNFEDPRLIEETNVSLLDRILLTARQICPEGDLYFFLDEIQIVEAWPKWMRLQVDTQSANHFVLSGSNSQLVSGDLSTVLTGRHLTFELFPLSFSEYQAAFPGHGVEDYLKRGGFPRPLKEDQPEHLLIQYFKDITEKDLRERLRARSSTQVQKLIKMIFESVGSELSLRRIAASLSLSADTVSLYLDAAESAYLTYCCPYFAYSERKVSHRNKKYYAVDTGLRRSIISQSGNDLGKDFENCVYLSLRRKYSSIFYWKGTREVDFVVETTKGIRPIQVTWQEPKERHELALDEFYATHRDALEPVYVNPDNFPDLCEIVEG